VPLYIEQSFEMALKFAFTVWILFCFPVHTSNQYSEMDLTVDPAMAYISVMYATKVLVITSI
jgi:hypothetical protein